MVAWQTDRGTLSLLSERANFEHGNVRLRLSVRVRLRRVHKADLLGPPVPETEGIPLNNFRSSQVPGTSSSQFSSSENFKFRNPEKKVNKKLFFPISTKKHFRYCLLPFHAL